MIFQLIGDGPLHILLNPQGLGIRTGTEACARNGEIPKFAKYAQILKNSVASEGDCQREDISDEGPGGSGWEALVVECRLLIMLLLYGIFKNSAKYVIEISHVPTLFVAQRLLYNH